MEDAIETMMQPVRPAANIRNAEAYNIQGMSFDPQTLFAEIRQHVPEFQAEFIPDFRQVIDGWRMNWRMPQRARWGWFPKVNLQDLVARMVTAKHKPEAMTACRFFRAPKPCKTATYWGNMFAPCSSNWSDVGLGPCCRHHPRFDRPPARRNACRRAWQGVRPR